MKVLCTPILHPAALLRGLWHLEAPNETYLKRVHDNPSREPLDMSKPPPGAILYPTTGQLMEFRDDATTFKAVSLDIENAGKHVICAGMTCLDVDTGVIGPSVCLRYRLRGGGLYWKPADMRVVTRILYDILADEDITKVVHNGVGHDIRLLEELGFTVGGDIVDTMGLVHCAYSELPKGLQFSATLWNGTPVWKSLTDDEDEDK